MTEILTDFERFEKWLRETDPLITDVWDLKDGTCCWIKRLFFHYTLIRGTVGDESGYFDRWCYPDRERASEAFLAWQSSGESEPSGWHRHPPSGRRRPDGDASREYVCH